MIPLTALSCKEKIHIFFTILSLFSGIRHTYLPQPPAVICLVPSGITISQGIPSEAPVFSTNSSPLSSHPVRIISVDHLKLTYYHGFGCITLDDTIFSADKVIWIIPKTEGIFFRFSGIYQDCPLILKNIIA